MLASRGYRVIVPFARGHGTTRFLSDDTFRNGQQAAVAADVIAHMDALGIDNGLICASVTGAVIGLMVLSCRGLRVCCPSV